MVKSISEQADGFTIEVALMNLKEVKHTYSRTNYQLAGAIIQSILDYVGSTHLQADMKASKKKPFLEEAVTSFSELIATFITLEDE